VEKARLAGCHDKGMSSCSISAIKTAEHSSEPGRNGRTHAKSLSAGSYSMPAAIRCPPTPMTTISYNRPPHGSRTILHGCDPLPSSLARQWLHTATVLLVAALLGACSSVAASCPTWRRASPTPSARPGAGPHVDAPQEILDGLRAGGRASTSSTEHLASKPPSTPAAPLVAATGCSSCRTARLTYQAMFTRHRGPPAPHQHGDLNPRGRRMAGASPRLDRRQANGVSQLISDGVGTARHRRPAFFETPARCRHPGAEPSTR